jgi:hypothetical protein
MDSLLALGLVGLAVGVFGLKLALAVHVATRPSERVNLMG